MPNSEPSRVQQRILDAATGLFSSMGYHGASTRDIARLAEVNETSIYRYYPRKRDLFVAALDAEFSKVRLRADLISRLSAATDADAAMKALIQVILEAVLQHRALVRLVHFSVLEFGEELHEIYGRHMTLMLSASSEYLSRWPELVEAQRFDTKIVVLAFIATLVALRDFYPVLSGEGLSQQALEQQPASVRSFGIPHYREACSLPSLFSKLSLKPSIPKS